MRHSKHRHILGVKKEHRIALMANLAMALIKRGRIKTTLAKAKALRPFIEKIITLAVKAHKATDPKDKLHYRRLAIARIRDSKAVAKLFDELAEEFENRPGGYTRIYKLMPRLGDAAEMALIEFVLAGDEGYKKRKKKPASAKKVKPRAKVDADSDNALSSSATKAEKRLEPVSKDKDAE